MNTDAEKEYMLLTEDSRKKLKYSPALARVIQDIIENGSTFTYEKWKNIYNNKEVTWRNNRILQEVMVRTKGLPDNMCQKILSSAFHKNVYKAVVGRDDLSEKNIEIALEGISNLTLNETIKQKGVSLPIINYIATRTINNLINDENYILKPYEISALEQTSDNSLIENYLYKCEFEDIAEIIIQSLINNPNLRDDVRETAFNIGWKPSIPINIALTKDMERVLVHDTLPCYFDRSISHRTLVNVIHQNLIDEKAEIKIIDAFAKKRRSPRSFRKDKILTELFTSTKNSTTINHGLNQFPSYADKVLFHNNHIRYDEISSVIDKALQDYIKNGSGKSDITQKIETLWNDIKFDDNIYNKVKKSYLSSNKVENLTTLLPFIAAKKTPVKFLRSIINGKTTQPHNSNEVGVLFNACKIIAMQNLAIRKAKLPFNMSKANISILLRQIGTNFSNNKPDLNYLNEHFVKSDEFIKHGEKYISIFQEILEKLKDNEYLKENNFDIKNINNNIAQIECITNELVNNLVIQRSLEKTPSDCDVHEVEKAKQYLLNNANLDIDKDPISYIINFEDNKTHYLALCKRENELKGIKQLDIIDEVFEEVIVPKFVSMKLPTQIVNTEDILEI
jgi:hypothetical protein